MLILVGMGRGWMKRAGRGVGGAESRGEPWMRRLRVYPLNLIRIIPA
jgi:ribosomal protein L15